MNHKKVIWNQAEEICIAQLMSEELKEVTFNNTSAKTKAYQKAFVNAQKKLPENRRKQNTFKQDLSGVAVLLEDILDKYSKTLNQAQPTLPINIEAIENILFSMGELITQDAAIREERINSRISQLENQIQNLHKVIQSIPVYQEAEKTLQSITPEAENILHICLVGLLQSRYREFEKRLKYLPIKLYFLDVDSPRTFPKKPTHDYVIVTKHCGHSQFQMFQKVYGPKVTFITGGISNITKHIEELISNHPASC